MDECLVVYLFSSVWMVRVVYVCVALPLHLTESSLGLYLKYIVSRLDGKEVAVVTYKKTVGPKIPLHTMTLNVFYQISCRHIVWSTRKSERMLHVNAVCQHGT